MIHHIKDTAEGIVSTLSAIYFGYLSISNMGNWLGLMSAVCAIIASMMAIRYYYYATKKVKQ